MAFEYLMSYLLLSNNVILFVDNLYRIKNFDYPSLPIAYEEALLIYKLRAGNEMFTQKGYSVSPETEARFARYYQLLEKQQIQTLEKEFGKTFWFYLNFINPYRKK